MNKFLHLLAVLALSLPMSLLAQTIKNYIDNDWPNDRYEVHDDGTVTDTVTGLMWLQCSLGQDLSNSCSGSATEHNWREALEAASSYVLGGYNDWRLPNIKELDSLAALDRYNPAINSTIFPNTPSDYYWSTSPDAGSNAGAWRLSFSNGSDVNGHRDYYRHVRLVRSNQ